jgi:hypothetical protein
MLDVPNDYSLLVIPSAGESLVYNPGNPESEVAQTNRNRNILINGFGITDAG